MLSLSGYDFIMKKYRMWLIIFKEAMLNEVAVFKQRHTENNVVTQGS